MSIVWLMADQLGASHGWFAPVLVSLPLALVFSCVFTLLLYVAGFALERSGRHITRLNHPLGDPLVEDSASSRVAIVMPSYHEDTEQVNRRIRATWRSVAAAGLGRRCDFYFLSDSADAAICAAEQEMIVRLGGEFAGKSEQLEGPTFDYATVREVIDPVSRIFLIRRKRRRNFKAGNIANFLAKHGRDYDYMLVLDADSVMLGETIRRMVLRMEASPKLAILQSTILPIGSITPFARAMQYSLARAMPLFARGQYWFFGKDSIYWGHNALIRIAPFMKHAQLPTLPGKPPLGGPILSQDIVEAALLGWAGWEIGWDVESGGSFDELPANILTYGKRDRRWCQGNFQHFPFIFWRGMTWGHRFYFANGIFTYLAGPLLLLWMLLGFVQALLSGRTLAFSWQFVWFLAAIVAIPRALGLWRLWQMDRAVRRSPSAGTSNTISTKWSGWRRELASTVIESAISVAVAPLIFFLHTRFVAEILSGRSVPWKNQSRDPGEGLAWGDGVRLFWLPTLVGAGWLWLCALRVPGQLRYLAPMLLSWVVSIPLSVILSSPVLGKWLVNRGLFPDAMSAEEAEQLDNLVQPWIARATPSPVKERSGAVTA